MLDRYAHLSTAHLWQAIEGLALVGTGSEGNSTGQVLQKSMKRLERETGFEPATLALARRCSTTELFPLDHNPPEGWDSTDAGTKLSSDLAGHTYHCHLVTFVSTIQKCYQKVTREYSSQTIDLVSV